MQEISAAKSDIKQYLKLEYPPDSTVGLVRHLCPIKTFNLPSLSQPQRVQNSALFMRVPALLRSHPILSKILPIMIFYLIIMLLILKSLPSSNNNSMDETILAPRSKHHSPYTG